MLIHRRRKVATTRNQRRVTSSTVQLWHAKAVSGKASRQGKGAVTHSLHCPKSKPNLKFPWYVMKCSGYCYFVKKIKCSGKHGNAWNIPRSTMHVFPATFHVISRKIDFPRDSVQDPNLKVLIFDWKGKIFIICWKEVTACFWRKGKGLEGNVAKSRWRWYML